MKKPLSHAEFMAIYSKVPRLNVELVIQSDKGVLLTKRSIQPFLGTWHLPGGTVYLKETFHDAAKRVAKEELGVDVAVGTLLGYIEYPSALEQSGFVGWPMGVAFDVKLISSDIRVNDEADTFAYFKQIPSDVLEDQKVFIQDVLREAQG